MDESNTVLPTQAEVTPAASPVSPPTSVAPSPKPTRNKFWLVVVLFAAGLLAGLVWYYNRPLKTPETALPMPTPTSYPRPTPTPFRPRSALSTTSAFMTFEQNVASLSAYLEIFPISEAAFTPPTIELELGLSK